MKLWDADSGRLLQSFGGHTDAVTGVAFLPDGHRVISGSKDQTLRLWDPTDGRFLALYVTVGSDTIAVLSDGLFVASGEADKDLSFVRGNELVPPGAFFAANRRDSLVGGTAAGK